MKTNIKRIAAVAAVAVLAFSAVMLMDQQQNYQTGAEDYAQAEALAGISLETVPLAEEPVPLAPPPEGTETAPDPVEDPEPKEVWVDPYADALAAMDFAALREVNDEVLGWILIPGTQVSYPLMAGEDNSKYLNTTWRGSRSSVGSIFLECQNSNSLTDFNTIIYGHRMNNGSMFGSLKHYAKQSYFEAHPHVYITDDQGCRTYAVFAAYEAGVTERTYQIGFADGADKQAFLDFCAEQSVIDTGVTPTAEDQILTLSTCTGRGYSSRWVVQAVRI